jgi:hypothetical protein
MPKTTTLRRFFEKHRPTLSSLYPHYATAYTSGLTRSYSSFKRHFYLWKAATQRQHVPPPTATAPLQEAFA